MYSPASCFIFILLLTSCNASGNKSVKWDDINYIGAGTICMETDNPVGSPEIVECVD